ncbi:AMP-dependent synthetase/ligase [Trinorchestia longiramus]|nr:AMP-dependent synthetase/ligase [Trinorchestia longiramus]
MVKQRSKRHPDNTWQIDDCNLLKAGFTRAKEFREEGVSTLLHVVEYSAKKNGTRPCMGTRTLINRQVQYEKGTKIEKLELGEYVWESYNDMKVKIDKVAASIMAMGFKPKSRIAILAETRADWFLMAVGCLRAGLTLVTLYTNLSDASVTHGINETEVDTVISSYDLLPRLCALLPLLKNVKKVIVLEDQLEGMGSVAEYPSNVSFLSFCSMLTNPDLQLLESYKGPSSDDIAIIMYTSGSTGNPKGVLLSHKNIFYGILAFPYKVNVKSDDCYLAFLPLPHVMELCSEVTMMALGVSIAYSSPYTFTSTSPKIMKGTLGDARVAQPTYINVVPLLIDRIIKGIFSTVEKQGKIKNKIFHEALRYKMNNPNGLTSSLANLFVFNKVKAELGGRIRLVISGGAPLSRRSHKIFTAMFGCDLKVGYGSTETTACSSMMDFDDNVPGSVGTPNRNCPILLENWEEGGYQVTDKPRPRGEVLIGGDTIAVAYLNLPEQSEESFVLRNGKRYFKTGDIGEFDDRGVLFLIDRKGDLIKLQNGEYVALGNVETSLKSHGLVNNMCAFGDTNKNYVVMVVVPAEEPLRKLAESIGRSQPATFENLCRDPKVINAVLNELTEHGKNQNLHKFELPKKLYLSTDEWTPGNGLITSAFKLRRKQLSKHYATQVAAMYSEM